MAEKGELKNWVFISLNYSIAFFTNAIVTDALAFTNPLFKSK
jgi:hypothetical protein